MASFWRALADVSSKLYGFLYIHGVFPGFPQSGSFRDTD